MGSLELHHWSKKVWVASKWCGINETHKIPLSRVHHWRCSYKLCPFFCFSSLPTQLHNKYHLDEFILLFSSLSTIFLFCYISLFGFYIYFDVFVKEKVVGFNGEGKWEESVKLYKTAKKTTDVSTSTDILTEESWCLDALGCSRKTIIKISYLIEIKDSTNTLAERQRVVVVWWWMKGDRSIYT
jgi:hypothetical protein